MIQKRRKLKHRSRTSCLYYAYGGKGSKNDSGLRCNLTTYAECNPDTCPWYRSQEMADASFEKARQNHIKQYGKDEYYQLGYGPKKRFNPRLEEEEE